MFNLMNDSLKLDSIITFDVYILKVYLIKYICTNIRQQSHSKESNKLRITLFSTTDNFFILIIVIFWLFLHSY